MAGVFLSYDRDDTDRARHFAHALEKAGHSVWWDLHVRGGAQFSKVIEEALKAADAVVVLWSKNAIESPWVRDEAAAGRDSGRLVPVTIDGTEPPLGFRQFQTLDLSRWKGRGNPDALKVLLADIAAMAGSSQQPEAAPELPAQPALRGRKLPKLTLPIAAVLGLILLLGVGAWLWSGRNRLPVVEVAAANASPASQAVASDLFVKLGSLAQVGNGKWQLVDASSGKKNPDLVFRTADTGTAAKPQVNVVLLNGSDNGLLWSREFTAPAGSQADLRQQLSLTAGRVLGCALDSREAGGLKPDLLKLFLNACAVVGELSIEDPESVSPSLRTIVAQQPNFKPAWALLLSADQLAVDAGVYEPGLASAPFATLRADMAKARRVAPDLPELTLSEIFLLPTNAYAEKLRLIHEAAQRAPNAAAVFAQKSDLLQSVGLMVESVQAAQRSAQLNPLSANAETQMIMTLAYAGQISEARQEITRAEKVWAGTGALRDLIWAFNMRFGDPKVAMTFVDETNEVPTLFLKARLDRSPSNLARLVAAIRPYAAHPRGDYMAFSTQALAEFDQIDDVFMWLEKSSTADVARNSYIYFRPAFENVRRDPRFMAVARRIGLAEYWLKSGKWPDFCQDPKLTYDCKTEAAKHG
jgi:hypothetical protein